MSIANYVKIFVIKRFPFEWKNPLGYLIAIGIQYAITAYGVLIGACIISLGIGSFLYVIASTKCIRGNLFAINRCTNDSDKQHIWDQFIEFIQYHSRVKQFSRMLGNILRI